MTKYYEIRDPVHGFIKINDWERDIINSRYFQRLRRIRQLALTDMIYPGAMHTRFEHSLGVMHIATQMFDRIRECRKDFLERELNYTEGGLERDRVLVRLAALLHDVGHAPFSHAGEPLMVKNTTTGHAWTHENYSAAIIRDLIKDVIENHPISQNYGIKAKDVADFLEGRTTLGRRLFWRGLISSQLDADRADYLLRDSLHAGVAYGNYDLHRLISTMTVAMSSDTDSPTLAVEEGGIHAAEGLIIARYMMFTQVYFQHTRRAYDFHIGKCISSMLEAMKEGDASEGTYKFPSPTSEENLKAYLNWDDWKVLGLLSDGLGGEDGDCIRERRHHRRVFETPEVPLPDDTDRVNRVMQKLGNRVRICDTAEKSWYKTAKDDILIQTENMGKERLIPLSRLSNIVNNIRAVSQVRIYVSCKDKNACKKIVNKICKRK